MLRASKYYQHERGYFVLKGLMKGRINAFKIKILLSSN